MLKKLVVAFGLLGWRRRRAERGRIDAAADCRRARRVDDKDFSVHRQRHDVFARPEHQPGGGLAEVLREKLDACLRFHDRDDAR